MKMQIKNIVRTLSLSVAALAAFGGVRAAAQEGENGGAVAARLIEAGFTNVRFAETDSLRVFAIENDRFKLPVEGFAVARDIIESSCSDGKTTKLIATNYDVPELTMTYNPTEALSWHSTKRLDEGWDALRHSPKLNSNFGKVNILVYPQVSLKNLIINQVYQSLWQLGPALEVSLWKGMKFTYQVQIPIYNDGYASRESKVHPGFVTLSQRFRDPWKWNIFGKATVGVFSGSRYGGALELAYYFPNERFSIDTQLGMLGLCYWNGFVLHYDRDLNFYWNFAANYYNPSLRTQFTLRAQHFLYGDYGVKYEMIRHFKRCSVGLYAEKGFASYMDLNVGFRFQIALPPFSQKRRGYIPKISTSSHIGMSYNANNEQVYYKEYRTESSDNIMSKNAYNPLYVDSYLK